MRQIAVRRVRPGTVLEQSVYAGHGQMLASAGTALNGRHLEALEAHRVPTILIQDEETADLDFTLGIRDETLRRAYIFVEDLLIHLRDNYMGLRFAHYNEAQHLAAAMFDDLTSTHTREMSLLPPRTAAEYRVQHPVNVAVIALVIGRRMRLSTDELRHTVIAALLMDIGTPWHSDELLAKLDPLTDQELTQVQQFPVQSHAMLREVPQCDPIVATIALQHHERWDGSGYPATLKGPQITVGARILALANTYDALQVEWPYWPVMPPNMAVEYVIAHAGEHFDPAVAEAFVRTIPSFPTGALVRLDGGDQGVVVRANLGLPGRPAVRIHYTATGQRVEPPVLVDLARGENQARSVASLLDDWEIAA